MQVSLQTTRPTLPGRFWGGCKHAPGLLGDNNNSPALPACHTADHRATSSVGKTPEAPGEMLEGGRRPEHTDLAKSGGCGGGEPLLRHLPGEHAHIPSLEVGDKWRPLLPPHTRSDRNPSPVQGKRSRRWQPRVSSAWLSVLSLPVSVPMGRRWSLGATQSI